MSNIPDFMPVLSIGKHASPQQGACAMEYISFLAGEEFSDYPACTYPALAFATQVLNDHLPNYRRHEIIKYFPRLMGSNSSDEAHGDRLTHWLYVQARRRAANLETPRWPTIQTFSMHIKLIEGIFNSFLPDPAKGTKVFDTEGLIGFYEELLDKWDEITGRTTYTDLTDVDFAKMRELANA
jgi:hypothetical protein